MTLAEFQPYVEAALSAHEWATARARWRAGLLDERIAIETALPLAGSYGIEEEPLQARLAQIERDLAGDVTADQVPQHPLRSVPMDLIAVAVIRRILRVPSTIPVLSIKTLPTQDELRDALASIAGRWQHPNGAQPDELMRAV